MMQQQRPPVAIATGNCTVAGCVIYNRGTAIFPRLDMPYGLACGICFLAKLSRRHRG